MWYKLSPGERTHVVNTNNTILYTYAKSPSEKKWAGSHRVNLGSESEPQYVNFSERRIGIDVPEEWTISFSSRDGDSDSPKVQIRYSIWNDTSEVVSFRVPGGDEHSLAPGKRGSYRSSTIAEKMKIFVHNTQRTYALTSGNHKFHWMNSKNRIGFDLRYDNDTERTQPQPAQMTVRHNDESNGRSYVYAMTAGSDSELRVSRGDILIHIGRFIGVTSRNGEEFVRYRLTYTNNTAPEWAMRATNEDRYEAWVPLDGNGVIRYSEDRGSTFVDESLVPPAGRCVR
jgi:hypothetical protein